MSDDEEMTDMSQVVTQSGTTQSGSNAFTSLSNIESDQPNGTSWGKMEIYNLKPRRSGICGPPSSYNEVKLRTFGKLQHCATHILCGHTQIK